jgi:hypothetical protein
MSKNTPKDSDETAPHRQSTRITEGLHCAQSDCGEESNVNLVCRPKAIDRLRKDDMLLHVGKE